MFDDELRAATDAATQGWNRPTAYEPDAELDENELDDESGEEGDEDLPAGWVTWADGLSAADRQHAIDDPNWARYQYELWLTRPENADEDEYDDEAEDGPRNAGEIGDWVIANAATIYAEYGYSPAEYLAWIGGMSRSQWAAFKAEAGFTDSLERPAYNQLPKSAQLERVRADVAGWSADTFKRLG